MGESAFNLSRKAQSGSISEAIANPKPLGANMELQRMESFNVIFYAARKRAKAQSTRFANQNRKNKHNCPKKTPIQQTQQIGIWIKRAPVHR
jgi:hypothetical protein